MFQPFGGERGGVFSITYALDNLGREQRQRDQELHITIVHVCLLIIPCALKALEFCADRFIVARMLTILCVANC